MCFQENDKWLDRVREYFVTSDYLKNIQEIVAQELNGRIVKSPNDKTVYLIQNLTKNPFLSRKAFESKGYSWGDIMDVKTSFLDKMKNGGWIK